MTMDPLTQPVSSLKPKLRRLSANLGVSVKSPFPAGPVIKRGWEMLGKSSKYRWGISTVDDNKRVPWGNMTRVEMENAGVYHWSNGSNGFFLGPSSGFLRILQIFPSTNSMNHSKWSQVVSSADMFFSDKCRSQRDFHRVDLVFTILNWLSKLLLKGIVSPLHHHYIHPQDHHCIPDTSRYPITSFFAINLPIADDSWYFLVKIQSKSREIQGFPTWFSPKKILSCGTCPSNGRLGEFDGWITY